MSRATEWASVGRTRDGAARRAMTSPDLEPGDAGAPRNQAFLGLTIALATMILVLVSVTLL